MSESGPAQISAETLKVEARNLVNDPLLYYESQSVGKEFTAYLPGGDERRQSELRKNQTIMKNWHESKILNREQAGQDSYAMRRELAVVRDFESSRAINSERMFLFVLCGMTVLLTSILLIILMNLNLH